MRLIIAIGGIAIALAACSGGSHTETAREAAKRQYEMMAKGQFGRVYDKELHPAVQETFSREDWLAKQGKSLFTIRKVRVIDSYDEPFTFPGGTRTVTAVTLGLTAGLGALPSTGDEQTITIHEELIDGKWRLFQN